MRSRLDAIDGPPVGRRTETDSEEVEINVDELYAEDAKTGVILLDCELRDSCEGEADEVTGMGVAVTVGKVAELVVRSWDVELVSPTGIITRGKSVDMKESKEKDVEESSDSVAVGVNEFPAVREGTIVASGSVSSSTSGSKSARGSSSSSGSSLSTSPAV